MQCWRVDVRCRICAIPDNDPDEYNLFSPFFEIAAVGFHVGYFRRHVFDVGRCGAGGCWHFTKSYRAIPANAGLGVTPLIHVIPLPYLRDLAHSIHGCNSETRPMLGAMPVRMMVAPGSSALGAMVGSKHITHVKCPLRNALGTTSDMASVRIRTCDGRSGA